MNNAGFRKELLKTMPGYSWTVHKTDDPRRLSATGIQSSGFNRLSTLNVIRTEREDFAWYEVKSMGHGTRGPWGQTIGDRTLARALRGLQDHYERRANNFRALAASLQNGRLTPEAQANNVQGVSL